MGVPPGIIFLNFFLPNSRFSTVSAPLSHVVKAWVAKSNLMTVDDIIYWQHVIACRFSRESWRRQISRLIKQTNFLQAKRGFITTVEMMRNVFSEQVFYGTSAVWCLYRPDTPHPFSAFKRNDDRKVIGNWGVSNGHCEHLCPCEQCVYFCEHEQWSVFSCEQRAPRRFSASWNLSL